MLLGAFVKACRPLALLQRGFDILCFKLLSFERYKGVSVLGEINVLKEYGMLYNIDMDDI